MELVPKDDTEAGPIGRRQSPKARGDVVGGGVPHTPSLRLNIDARPAGGSAYGRNTRGNTISYSSDKAAPIRTCGGGRDDDGV